MMLNKELVKSMKDTPNLDVDTAILYLLALYHNLSYEGIDEITRKRVNSLNIIERDLNLGGIKWNYTLYEGQVIIDEWSWVNTEFREAFGKINKVRKGDKRACINRMKKYFSDNPTVRKEDVLEATKMYLSSLNSSAYCKKAHKFIYEGSGLNKTSMLNEWIEIYDKKKNLPKNNKIKMMGE